jgi:hypothetical protein
LLKGCEDADGGVTGQVLRYLQEFSSNDFDDESRRIISGRLSAIRMPHYRELVLLAGYIRAGKDELYRQMFNAGLPERQKWYVALALARMGDKAQTAYCMERVKKCPLTAIW